MQNLISTEIQWTTLFQEMQQWILDFSETRIKLINLNWNVNFDFTLGIIGVIVLLFIIIRTIT
jgi:hypothetical protein